MANYSVDSSNYNVSVQFDSDELEDIRNHKYDFVECLFWALDWVDTVPLGEQFVSGYRNCVLLYSYYSGKVFMLDFADAEDILMGGKSLTLIAREPSEYNLTNDEVEEMLNG